jgi:hypothetical protein
MNCDGPIGKNHESVMLFSHLRVTITPAPAPSPPATPPCVPWRCFSTFTRASAAHVSGDSEPSSAHETQQFLGEDTGPNPAAPSPARTVRPPSLRPPSEPLTEPPAKPTPSHTRRGLPAGLRAGTLRGAPWGPSVRSSSTPACQPAPIPTSFASLIHPPPPHSAARVARQGIPPPVLHLLLPPCSRMH